MAFLPDYGRRERDVCGRECADGTPCQNYVDTPGATCHIATHHPDDPRVDGGPTSPGDAGPDVAYHATRIGIIGGKALVVGGVLALGVHPFLANIAAIAFIVIAAPVFAVGARLIHDHTTRE